MNTGLATFQVVDAGLYFRNMEKLIQDIAVFNPDVITQLDIVQEFGPSKGWK